VLEWHFSIDMTSTNLAGTVEFGRWQVEWTIEAVADVDYWRNYEVTSWSGPVSCRYDNFSSGDVFLQSGDFSSPDVAGIDGAGVLEQSCLIQALCVENADPNLFDRKWSVAMQNQFNGPGCNATHGCPPEFARTLNGGSNGTGSPFIHVTINDYDGVVSEKALDCSIPEIIVFDKDTTFISASGGGTPTVAFRSISDWEDGIGSFKRRIDAFSHSLRRIV
jgi:hypothetical protein